MRQSFGITVFAVLFLFFVGYLIFRFQDFWRGPEVAIAYPEEGETLTNSRVLVQGRGLAVSRLELNGRPIYTQENGEFEAELILASGLNIIQLKAQGRFGREFVERRTVMVKLPQ